MVTLITIYTRVKSVLTIYIFLHWVYLLFDNIDCMNGYTGLNCTAKCPYPTYGRKCQGICDCNLNQCDASRGCKSQTSGNVLLKVHIVVNKIWSNNQLWLLSEALLWYK